MDSIRKSLGSRKKKNRSHTNVGEVSETDFSSASETVEYSEQETSKVERSEKKRSRKLGGSSSDVAQEKILEQLVTLTASINEQQKINQQQIELLKLREQQVALARSKISLEKEPEPEQEAESEPEDIPVVVPPLLEMSGNNETQFDKYSRDVRRAFQIATSQLILLVLLVLGYFTVSVRT